MKHKILLTTTLTASFLGYYRRAYSNCTGSNGTYTCSGSTTTNQSISSNNAQVSTADGFNIETNNNNRVISIIGSGANSFTDENSSTIKNTGSALYGLYISSFGNINNGNAGSITVNSNSNINLSGATSTGINTANVGTGATNINISGNIYSNTTGINIFTNSNASVTTSQNSKIVSGAGIHILEAATATLNISGDITAGSTSGRNAIFITELTNAAANITIQNGATISGDKAIASNQTNDVAFDVTLNGSDNAVSITGSSGTAIEFDTDAANNDSLAINGTVAINGDINFGAGTDTLSLNNTNLTLANETDFVGLENVTLSGSNILNGSFNLNGITVSATNGSDLKINGSLTSSLNLGNGSILSGNNTINGSVVAASGASIAPGNSIGTITVNGDVTFNSGSSFDVEVDGNNADKLIADNITIETGATINITRISNATSTSATILEANDSLTGRFSNIVTNNADNVTLVYTDKNLNLSFVTLNTDNLSSQIQSSVDSSILFNDNLTNQLALNAFDKGNNFWARGIYRNQDISAKSSGGFGYNNNSYGIAFGTEYELTSLASNSSSYKLGFALSQVSDSLNIKSAQGSRKSQSSFATIYGSYNKYLHEISSQFFTSLSLGFGYHIGNNKRLVTNSQVSSYAISSSKDKDISATWQTGLKLNLAKERFFVMPYVSASYIKTFAGGFNEKSGGNSAITINDYSFETAKYRESIRFGANLPQRIKNIILSPYLDLGLSQERSIGKRNFSGKFNVSQSNFNANLATNDRNFIITTIGLKTQLTKNISSFLSFERSSSNQEVRNEAKLGVAVKF